MHMTPVNALFPVSSTGNGMTYEGWSSKSDAFTSLSQNTAVLAPPHRIELHRWINNVLPESRVP